VAQVRAAASVALIADEARCPQATWPAGVSSGQKAGLAPHRAVGDGAARGALGLLESATPHVGRRDRISGPRRDLRAIQSCLATLRSQRRRSYTAVDAERLLDVYRSAHPRA
jgi:integrase/recombinase XerC